MPNGVLGVDKIQAPQKSETESQTVELGWKTQSLKSAADSLLNSATRLEKELEAETRYWDQVLKIKEQGWSVTRLPREKHTLGVRFGFAEGVYINVSHSIYLPALAHADFRDRGMAALRRDDDGNISLDRGLKFAGDRKLRVRILQHGTIISCSRLSTLATDAEEAIEDDSIEEQILQARNSLFDEELYAELHREARNLTNQGVNCIGDSIQLPYESDKSIQIDLIDIDDIASEGPGKEDWIPTGIDIALHVLLSHAHRQNLRRRSAPPPPLNEGKRPRPIYQILKPIIEHLRHRTNIQSCTNFLTDLTKTLATADLTLTLQQDTTSSWNIPANLTSPQTNPTETLLQSLTAPPQSTFTLSLPSSTLTLTLLTNLFPPSYGTTYHSTLSPSTPETLTAKLPPTTSLTSASDLEAHIIHILTVDLVDHIRSSLPGWSVEDQHTGVLSRTFENGSDEGGMESVTVRVIVEARRLVLEWMDHVEEEGKKRAKQRVVWEQGIGDPKGLLDIVGGIGARGGEN